MSDEQQREEWHNAYLYELKELYYILMTTIDSHYNIKDHDDTEAFHQFSRLVYNDSSKYISEYTIANCSNSLSE